MLCGECKGPFGVHEEGGVVLLAPCAHVLHSQCSSFVHKRTKLMGKVDIRCPLCRLPVHNVTPLYLSEGWDDGDDAPVDDAALQGGSLDPAAMLTRVFHYQRRCLMHQRKVIELQQGLKDIQKVLASSHQRAAALHSTLGSFSSTHLARHSLTDGFVFQVDWMSLKELAIEDVRRIDVLREKISKLKGKSEASAAAMSYLKFRIREYRSQGVRLPNDTVEEEDNRSTQPPPPAQPLPPPTPSACCFVDVDASSSSDDVAIIERPSAVAEEDDASLPPLFPMARHRASGNMPTVGVSTGRSLRDLPRPEDAKFQHGIDKWSKK